MILSACSRAGQRLLKMFTWHPSYPNHRGTDDIERPLPTTPDSHVNHHHRVLYGVQDQHFFDIAMTMFCRCDDTHDGKAWSVDGTYKSDQEYSCPTFVLRFDSHVHQHHRVLYGVQDQHFFDIAMTMFYRCEDTHDGKAWSVDGTCKSDQEYACPPFCVRFDNHAKLKLQHHL